MYLPTSRYFTGFASDINLTTSDAFGSTRLPALFDTLRSTPASATFLVFDNWQKCCQIQHSDFLCVFTSLCSPLLRAQWKLILCTLLLEFANRFFARLLLAEKNKHLLDDEKTLNIRNKVAIMWSSASDKKSSPLHGINKHQCMSTNSWFFVGSKFKTTKQKHPTVSNFSQAPMMNDKSNNRNQTWVRVPYHNKQNCKCGSFLNITVLVDPDVIPYDTQFPICLIQWLYIDTFMNKFTLKLPRYTFTSIMSNSTNF